MKAIKLAVGFVSVFVAGGVLGKTLTVRAEGLSERAKYVRRVTLNGRRVTARALSHADLVKGGELVFEMADAPCDFAGQFQGHFK